MTFGFPTISATMLRLIVLPIAAGFLLAAGEASNSSSDRTLPTSDSTLLAPMTPAEASAASAALAATLPAGIAAEFSAAPGVANPPAIPPTPRFERLSALVGTIDTADVGDDRELRCLATAVYFESRGEPLEGQLAVAQAIINRSTSGRYADTICGVINQPGQFSFDRNRTPATGNDWRTAQAIARIAADDMWREVAPRAVSFHAARLSPGWRDKVRIARIGNHVFYR
jgi:hypothetical protein